MGIFANIKPMPRKKKAKKMKMKSGSMKTVFAVLLVLLGIIALVSIFVNTGSILSLINTFQFGLLGYGALFLPFIVILLALLMFENLDNPLVDLRVLMGLVLMAVSTSSFFGSVASEQAGGFIGSRISAFLIDGLTVVGAVIVAIFGVGLSLIFIFDISFDQILAFVKEKAGNAKIPSFKSQVLPGPVINGLVDTDEEEEETALEVQKSPVDKIEVKEEPTFEVVQTSMEPLDTKSPKHSHGTVPVLSASTVSGLPYTDKVWEYPPLDLLQDGNGVPADRGDVKQRAATIERTLSQFGIKARVAEMNFGPAVTQYALEFTSVNKIAKVTNLQNDIALALASPTGSVRVEAPIAGKSLIGIEVPNISTALVNFKTMMVSDVMKSAKSKLTASLGLNVAGLPCVADIAKMPHMLVAGSTGSGKSVFIHSVLFSLLYRCSPAECKFILVDPKRVELTNYNDIPHLLVPVITDAEKAPNAFKWAVSEMERRYKLFENAKVRNLNAYNELSGFQALPNIVIIVDELAELMALAPQEMEKSIARLAQLSRATGIHLLLATQSPRVDVITGLIKANIPTRISFMVSSQVESRIIIDSVGAEKLLGKGDMLYVPPETSKPVRIQGVYVSDKEINNLVTFLKNSGIKPEYKEEVLQAKETKLDISESTDELFDEAVKIITLSDKASASLLQRKLSIGYARAARLLDELEARGIVGAADGSKPRDVLVRDAESVINSAHDPE